MTNPTPDNAVAVEFLSLWAPAGPWVLTSIATDRKQIATETFRPNEVTLLTQWLEKFNGSRNIYFHVNPPMRDITKKANREDIKSVDWLHIDIDPRAGEDLEEERVRALGLLQDKLPVGVPAPTCIVFSGGGYQGFWRLQDPIQIDGDLPKAEDAKLYNVQLELLFGADNCHNIDRIMRLPGTINVPDARKLKKGRVPTLAYLVEFNDNVYPLSDFNPAPVVQTPGDSSFGGGEMPVDISGNVERIEDVSELDPWDVPDRVKIIMAQGSHPDQPKEGDNSRSAWLFDFCCQMIRHEVPDDVIYSIITDPQWAISESVIECKGSVEKYAIKQIQSAKEWAIDPWLKYFNDKYAVIKNYGGRCLVVSEEEDFALQRQRLTKRSLENFEKGYEKDKIQIGEDANGAPKFMRAGKWWRYHAKRRQFDTITFAPERKVPKDVYNMWKGFAVQSLPGDCSLFLDHILNNVCGGNEEYFDYLMGWMARAVQNPGEPGEVAVVLRGGRGVGKSLFASEFGKLFGRHFMQVSNSGHLVGNFNSHLRDLVVLFADEAFYAGDKRHESILKTIVTEHVMAIEAKGVDVENAPNYIHLIMASNDMHVIPAGSDERRFFVLDVMDGRQGDAKYFGALLEQLNNGGREALLHTLRTRDLSDYHVRRVPQTEALKEQKILSLSVEEEWWYEKLDQGRLLREGTGWLTEVSNDALVDDFVEHTRRFNVTKRGNQVTLGKFLKRLCPSLESRQINMMVDVPTGDGWTRKERRRLRCYILPELDEARRLWDDVYGAEDWEQMDDQPELGYGDAEPPF